MYEKLLKAFSAKISLISQTFTKFLSTSVSNRFYFISDCLSIIHV